jgi:hypothetical protein
MRFASFLVLFLFVQGAFGEQLDVFVEVKCTPNLIEVQFDRTWNRVDELTQLKRIPNKWNTEELRSITSADDVHYQTTPRPKAILCLLAGMSVRVVVQPQFAPGWHPTGKCATRTGANIKVYRGGELIVTEGLDACTEIGEVPVSIVVHAKGSPSISRMSAREFLNGP